MPMIPFVRCECSMLGCNHLVEVTIPDYKAVRGDSRRFLLAPGHEVAEVEVLVSRKPGYIIVEKVGEAGRAAAEDSDPRSD
jgi:hypothetical protein